VSFAAITLCVASQRVFIVVYFVMTQSGNFWMHPRIFVTLDPTKFLACSEGLNMDTINGTTHIKTIFSFSLGNDKHFLFLSNDQETTSYPEIHEHDGRSEVVHHLTGKLFPQGYEAKRLFSIIASKVSPVNISSLKKKGVVIIVFLSRA
jgi:hypothetical protein